MSSPLHVSGGSGEGRAESFAAYLPQGKMWFTPREMADLVGCSAQYIRNCIDDQRVLAHGTPAVRRHDGQESERLTYRIRRESVLLFLFANANYKPADVLERVEEILRRQPLPAVRALFEKLLSDPALPRAGRPSSRY